MTFKTIHNVNEITISELKTGDHDGHLHLKIGNILAIISFHYMGGYAYYVKFLKDGKEIEYFEDTKILSIKKKIREKIKNTSN